MKISYCFKHSLVTCIICAGGLENCFLGESNKCQTCQAGHYNGSLLSSFSTALTWFRLDSDQVSGCMTVVFRM